MAEEVGVAYVRLLPSMRGFAKAAARELGSALSGPSRKVGKETGEDIGDEVDNSLSAKATRISQGFAKKLAGGLRTTVAASIKPVAITTATAFGGSFVAQLGASLASGTAAIAHGLGAALALAPAAALAGVAAFGALKLAVVGVGDALKEGLAGDTEKFNEALKGLAPPAQAFARQIVGLKDRLDDLKNSVQGAFFSPLVDQIAPLARIYLPQARIALTGIASSFGEAGARAAEFLRLPATARILYASLLRVRDAVGNVAAGLPNLIAAFLPLVSVGSTFLPGLTTGFEGLTARVAEFMQQAERTGRLRAFIQGGVDGLKELWGTARQVGRILGNVGSIIRTVFAASGFAGLIGGGGLLDSIERLTERVRTFLQTERGARALAGVWGLVRQAIDGVKDTASRVFQILSDVIGPLLPQLADFASAFMRLKTAVIDVGLDMLEPVLRALGAVLGAVVLPALTGLANFLATNRPALHALAAIVLTLLIPAFASWAAGVARSAAQVGKNIHGAATAVGRGAAAGARGLGRLTSGFRSAQAAESAFSGKLGTLGGKLRTGVNAIGRFATAAVRGVGRAATAFGRLAVSAAQAGARMAVTFARMAAQAAVATARVAAQIAIQIARWVAMGIAALISAAQVALAWIISMGPILLVAAAIAAFVALVIVHWDTIVAATKAAFTAVTTAIGAAINWVKTNWPLLLAILTGPIGIAVLLITKHWDTIKDGVTAVKDWIVDKFNAVLGFFTGLPGRIASVTSGMWDGIKNAFRSAINAVIGWWNGLSFTFPVIEIPRIEVFGRGIGGGSFGGWTVSTPSIPRLAEGAVLKARPGGVPFIGAEAGEDEAVAPLSKLDAMIRRSVDVEVSRFAASPAPAPDPSRLEIDVTNGTDDLIRVVKKWIRTRGTGNVQVALGP